MNLHTLSASIGVLTDNGIQIASEINRLAPKVKVVTDAHDFSASGIEMLIAWRADAAFIGGMQGLKLVQSTGAGVDGLLGSIDPRGPVRLCKTVDGNLVEGMTSYVAWAALDHVRHMQHYRAAQRDGLWLPRPSTSLGAHRVGVAGAGEMGLECARALATLGFAAHTWSRSPRQDGDAKVAHRFGEDGLLPFLGACDTLICVLPLTESTRGFLSRRVFSQLPAAAHVINVGRGGHLIETDLLDALDSGQLSRATLDVTHIEPLPRSHPFWGRPDVVLTLHIAARANPISIARQALHNLLAVREGRAPLHVVDLGLGY